MTAHGFQPVQLNETSVIGNKTDRYRRSTATTYADSWTDEDFKSAVGDVFAMHMYYLTFRRVIHVAMLHVGFFLVAIGFYGWKRVKGNVLVVAVVVACVQLALGIARDILSVKKETSGDIGMVLYALYWLPGFLLLHRFIAPSQHSWRRLLPPLMVSPCNDALFPLPRVLRDSLVSLSPRP